MCALAFCKSGAKLRLFAEYENENGKFFAFSQFF